MVRIGELVCYLVCVALKHLGGMVGRKLILVATPQERALVDWDWMPPDCELRLCGFGPIVAGIQAARLINDLKPDQVFLVGLAGTYDADACPVGTALEFGSCGIFGIGAGSGTSFLRPHQMGWAKGSELGVRDEIVQLADPQGPKLLTVCSAAADGHDVDLRQEHFPCAVAEDMESWSVALACQFAGLTATVVRGISNRAGNRDWEKWRSKSALEAAIERLQQSIGRSGA